MKLSDSITNDPIRALIYGNSGNGKTTLIGLMALHPELRPIYIADCDLRASSLRARIPKEFWPFIEVEPFRDTNIQGEAAVKIQAKLERVSQEGFKTFVLDSLTFYLDSVMARMLMLDGNKSANSVPQLQNYNGQTSHVKEFVSRACAKPLNIIVTCLEGTNKDETTGRMFKGLALPPKLTERIPGHFNEIWHPEVQQLTGKEPVYVVRTRSDMIYAARTSYRSLETLEKQDQIWPKVLKERNAQN